MEKRLRQQVDMKMNNVEIIGVATDLAQHGQRTAEVIADSRKPQTFRSGHDKLGRRLRFSARVTNTPVLLSNKPPPQPGPNPLGPAIELAWHRFRQRRDERDTH